MITEDGDARLGDFGITAIITDPTVVERDSMTTSKPGVTRYMAPELLNPQQFGFKHSNPSKESDVYSFAMTAYEVFYSYFVAHVIDRRLLPSTRSSLETCRMVCGRRASPPIILYPATDRPAQEIQWPTSGYLIRSGRSSGAAGTRTHASGCPPIYYIKDSLNRNRNMRRVPRPPGVVEVGRDPLENSLLTLTFRHSGGRYQVLQQTPVTTRGKTPTKWFASSS